MPPGRTQQHDKLGEANAHDTRRGQLSLFRIVSVLLFVYVVCGFSGSFYVVQNRNVLVLMTTGIVSADGREWPAALAALMERMSYRQAAGRQLQHFFFEPGVVDTQISEDGVWKELESKGFRHPCV